MTNYTKYINHLFLFFLFAIDFSIAEAHQQHVNFTENKGQWLDKVQFRANLDGGALFVEHNCFTYHFYNNTALHKNHINTTGKQHKVNTHAFKMNFVNSNSDVNFLKSEKTTSHSNYFIGNNKKNWKSNVDSWERIIAKNIYNGIDMESQGIQNGIKYQFNVAAKANYKNIQLSYEGVEKIWIQNKQLHIKTSVNEMVDQAPIAWQMIEGKKHVLECNYVLNKNTVSFELSKDYNSNYELIIDPVLVFASYTGSTSDNFGLTATYDSFGNLYTGGLIYNIGYPTTVGAYDTSYNGIATAGRTDISISKFDSTGANLLYSTYFGGSNNTEVVHSMVVNSLDELCIFGTTGSNDFPISSGAYDTSFNGGILFNGGQNGANFENGTDMFVSKFSVDGSQLLSSTYIGGTDNDGLNTANFLNFNYGDIFRGEINVDVNDNILVGSSTFSLDFPVTTNAVQPIKGDLQDGCIFKFDSNLQNLIYSTFVGGNSDDAIYAIASTGTNVYASGGTRSTNLPTTTNSYHSNFMGGNADGIVVKISTTNNNPMLVSYVGTNNYDQSYFVQLDESKNVYLFGQTNGAFPFIGGVYQNANSGQFILKLDSTLSIPFFSTTFGNSSGSTNISPSAFLVDNCGRIYISGWGGDLITSIPTLNMPLTSNAFQSSTDGFNFYLAVFGRNMDSLLYATYFGGASSREHVDGGTSRFDKRGIVYQSVCAGCGSNDDFPTTPGAWSNVNGSTNCNNGVFKFDFEIGLLRGDYTASPESGCAPLTVTFTNSSPDNFLWDFGNNDTTSTDINPTRTFAAAGVYPVKLIITNNNTCNFADTIVKFITVLPELNADFANTIVPCENTINFTDLSINTYPTVNSWLWNFGDGDSATVQNPSHTYSNSGTFTVALTVTDATGCSGTIDTLVTLNSLTAVQNILSNCGNNNVQFNAQPDSAGGYLWNFGNQGSPNNTSVLQSANHLYPDTGNYNAYLVVYWGNNNECSDTSFFDVNINPPFVASIDFDQDSCSNLVTFTETTNLTSNPSIQWQWAFGDGQGSTLQNPIHNYLGGNYNASLIVTALDGCIDTVSVPINIKNYSPYFLNNDTVLCNSPTEILLQARGGDFYLWQPISQFTNPTSSNQLVLIDSTFTYTVQIGRVNAEGDTCLKTFETEVTVLNLGQATLLIDAEKDTIFVGESTPINVEISNGNYSFLWSPSQGINNPNTDNVIASPTESTTYTLTVLEGNTCSRSEKVDITVFKADCSESSLFIPNTFSPNNDGKNDKLMVRGNYIAQMYFAVYNRWGEKVFETNDKNIGWDGYFQSNMADPGVFGWYLKATCRDGETKEMKGNVTLIR
jgi:gliding motility-associated-like protein